MDSFQHLPSVKDIVYIRLPRIKTRPYLGQVKSFARVSPEMDGIPEANMNGKVYVAASTAPLANWDPVSMMLLALPKLV